MKTELETIAPAATLDFRDVVRNLEWREKWPLGEGLALKLKVGQRLHEGGALVAGQVIVPMRGEIYFDFKGPATLREVVDRGRHIGHIAETSSSRRREFSAEVVEKAMPMQIEKL